MSSHRPFLPYKQAYEGQVRACQKQPKRKPTRSIRDLTWMILLLYVSKEWPFPSNIQPKTPQTVLLNPNYFPPLPPIPPTPSHTKTAQLSSYSVKCLYLHITFFCIYFFKEKKKKETSFVVSSNTRCNSGSWLFRNYAGSRKDSTSDVRSLWRLLCVTEWGNSGAGCFLWQKSMWCQVQLKGKHKLALKKKEKKNCQSLRGLSNGPWT